MTPNEVVSGPPISLVQIPPYPVSDLAQNSVGTRS